MSDALGGSSSTRGRKRRSAVDIAERKNALPPKLELRFEMQPSSSTTSASGTAARAKLPPPTSMLLSDLLPSTTRRGAAPTTTPSANETRIDEIVFDPDWAQSLRRVERERAHIFEKSATTMVKNLLEHVEGADGVWPVRTRINCWWCCASFMSVPLMLPARFDCRKPRPFLGAKGVFCSFNCAQSYNVSLKDAKVSVRSEALHILKSRILEIPIAKCQITPAPPRETLKQFGGHLEVHEFRTGFDMLETVREGDAREQTKCMLLHRMVVCDFDRVLVSHGDGRVTEEDRLSTTHRRALPMLGSLEGELG
jgi:hypothetical protein